MVYIWIQGIICTDEGEGGSPDTEAERIEACDKFARKCIGSLRFSEWFPLKNAGRSGGRRGGSLQGGFRPLQPFEGFSDILHAEKNEWEGREALWRKEQRVQDGGHCRKIKYEAQVQGSP